MIEDLLPYYEKQLQDFAIQSREFADRYPKIAQRLSLNQEQIDDPHIERLIQAFSLISARIDKKLNDSYDIFTRSLFDVMFPQYLKPFPACTVVSFEDLTKTKRLNRVSTIPKRTTLKAKSVRGVQCEYQTIFDVHLMPIQLNSVSFKTNPSVQVMQQNALLVMDFEVFQHQHKRLKNYHLPIYLDAIANFPLQVLDSIFKANTQFVVKINGETIEITNPFHLLGFDEKECLLPNDQHTHHAYRLLMEYFCFPEKFNFLNLNLDFLNHPEIDGSNFQLQILLKLDLNDQVQVNSYEALSVANFKLFCAPVINLFEKSAEPQKITHQNLEYPLIADVHHPEYFWVYSIQKMHLIREKIDQEKITHVVVPFFAMSHYQPDKSQFYYHLRVDTHTPKQQHLKYSIISKALKPQSTSSDFMSAELLCSNGELPHESFTKNQNVLNLNDSRLARRAIMLKRPNLPYVLTSHSSEQWRIISHLSLNNLSLMKGNVVTHLKELLTLYNLSQSKQNNLIIDSIKDIYFENGQKMIDHHPFPVFIRGLIVKIKLDVDAFHGASIFIFSHLLQQLFSLKVQINSYVDLTVLDASTEEELYQCTQHIGGKQLL